MHDHLYIEGGVFEEDEGVHDTREMVEACGSDLADVFCLDWYVSYLKEGDGWRQTAAIMTRGRYEFL